MASTKADEMKRRRLAAAAEAPKGDEVKLEETKVGEPKSEAPNADEPITEDPKADADDDRQSTLVLGGDAAPVVDM